MLIGWYGSYGTVHENAGMVEVDPEVTRLDQRFVPPSLITMSKLEDVRLEVCPLDQLPCQISIPAPHRWAPRHFGAIFSKKSIISYKT